MHLDWNPSATLHGDDAQARRGHPAGLRHHAELLRALKQLETIFLQFQRIHRALERQEESEPIRVKLGSLKRELSERLPQLLQPIGAGLDELEFWQPGISSRFYEIWLDPPLLIQGSATWLRYLGQWRQWLLGALAVVGGAVAGADGDRYGTGAEPTSPSTPAPSNPSVATTKETERHFTPKELAELWGLDQSTVRRIFRDEPGVLRIPHLGRRGKRDYVTFRIPASVAARVHERRSRSLLKI